MAQYHIGKNEYVDRNNDLFEVFMLGDETGDFQPIRYTKDPMNRTKAVIDRSLFYSTWTYRILTRVWEEYRTNIIAGTAIPQQTFINCSSIDHKLSVRSGIIANEGSCFRSKRHIHHKPNRGQLYSTSVYTPLSNIPAIRMWGQATIESGYYFKLVGDGTDWDLFVVRKQGNVELNVVSIKDNLPSTFNPELLHTYDIQFNFRGSEFHFFVDRNLVHTISLDENIMPVDDPALPVYYCSVCLQAGVQAEIQATCVDVTSEGGSHDRSIFSSVNSGSGLKTLGNASAPTAILAIRIPRTVTYNGQPHYNSRGVIVDKLVSWTRDEANTSIYITRDTYAFTMNGLAWLNVDDSNMQYIRGGNNTPLNTAFNTDVAVSREVINEWCEADQKNSISNPSRNAEYYLTPGDILVVVISAIANNTTASATLYMSEEF